MAELWFWLCALMVACYAAADGFDLGAGTLHLFVGRSDRERRQVLAAIGPFWDGNEVWLLASGGALFLAFPKVLASSFSGLYLAIVFVVWLLILRGIAIEFRSHVRDPLWRKFWDVGFCGASCALPILFGAALGNVLRGVPLDEHGWFALPLFDSFSPHGALGVLDTYTVTVGVFTLLALVLHGANFLSWKADGPVEQRARAVAHVLWVASLPVWIGTTLYTFQVNPAIPAHLRESTPALALLALAVLSWLGVGFAQRRRHELAAFLASTLWILTLLATAAACVFPVLLRSTEEGSPSLTILNAASSEASLRSAAMWWFVGAPIAVSYLAFLMWMHRGKAVAAQEGEGY